MKIIYRVLIIELIFILSCPKQIKASDTEVFLKEIKQDIESIHELEVINMPESQDTFASVTPEMLKENYYDYKFINKNVHTNDPILKAIIKIVENATLNKEYDKIDCRWGVILKTNKVKYELYFVFRLSQLLLNGKVYDIRPSDGNQFFRQFDQLFLGNEMTHLQIKELTKKREEMKKALEKEKN